MTDLEMRKMSAEQFNRTPQVVVSNAQQMVCARCTCILGWIVPPDDPFEVFFTYCGDCLEAFRNKAALQSPANHGEQPKGTQGRERMKRKLPVSFTCYLDILPRDDDGMGFALELEPFRGQYVKITIEAANDGRCPVDPSPTPGGVRGTGEKGGGK